MNGKAHHSRGVVFGTASLTLCSCLLVAGLNGCATEARASDLDGQSASEIADKARQALLEARSLHLNVTAAPADASAPAADTYTPHSFELVLDQEGNCVGSFRLPADKGSFDIVKRGERVWLKADKAFWKTAGGPHGEAVAELVGDRYIAGAADEKQLAQLSSACDLRALQREVGSGSGRTANLTKDGTGTVDGQETIILTGRNDEGNEGTIHVATEGVPYPLKITEKDNGGEQTILLSDWNEPVPPRTPSRNDTLDISKLQELQGI